MDGRLDPWELPPLFFMSKDESSSLRTPSGYWKEKEGEFIAIRSREESSSGSPSYEGTRRTLQFYLKDGTRGGEGTKTDWMIHQYHHLRLGETGESLLLQEDRVLCKVFKKGAAYQYSCDLTQVDSDFEHFKKEYSGVEQPDGEGLDGEDMGHQARSAILCVDFLRLCVDYLQLDVDHLQLQHQNKILQQDIKILQQQLIIWQHFTKIRTKDEVYAACHRCDKLLKAHPKKHGTSQLERHRNSDKCRSCCTNPSTNEDREMLRLLRAVLDDPYEQQKMEEKQDCQEDLTQLDPRDLILAHLTPWYVTRSFNRQTQGGHWEEIRKEFTAIRMEQQQMQGRWEDIAKDVTVFQMDQLQLQMQVPQPEYIGLRRTLQFHLQNGKKINWIMHEYQQLDAIEPAALFLQGDMAIRKVLHYDKDVVASAFSDLNTWLNGDDDTSEEYSYMGEGVNTEITTSSDYMNGGGGRKRKRSASSKRRSEVWMYFTEIHTTDPDVVYAVCHHCDRGYSSGRSTNGTSHLWRHKKSCTSKLSGTGNLNNGANAAWEAEIWPLFLLFKKYGETEH